MYNISLALFKCIHAIFNQYMCVYIDHHSRISESVIIIKHEIKNTTKSNGLIR